MRNFTFFLLIALVLGIPVAKAKEEQFFTDYLGGIIYNACQGYDLKLSSGHSVTFTNGATSSDITWPYTSSTVRALMVMIGNSEPYYANAPNCENPTTVTSGPGGGNGCGLLTCGPNKLDVNETDYYWNGTRIQPPQSVYNVTNNVANNNLGNLVQGSPNASVTQIQAVNGDGGGWLDFLLRYLLAPIVVGVVVWLATRKWAKR